MCGLPSPTHHLLDHWAGGPGGTGGRLHPPGQRLSGSGASTVWEDPCRLRHHPPTGLGVPWAPHALLCLDVHGCPLLGPEGRPRPLGWRWAPSQRERSRFRPPPDGRICVCCCRRHSQFSVPLAMGRRSRSCLGRGPRPGVRLTASRPGVRLTPRLLALRVPGRTARLSSFLICSVARIFRENILLVKSQTLAKRSKEKPK